MENIRKLCVTMRKIIVETLGVKRKCVKPTFITKMNNMPSGGLYLYPFLMPIIFLLIRKELPLNSKWYFHWKDDSIYRAISNIKCNIYTNHSESTCTCKMHVLHSWLQCIHTVTATLVEMKTDTHIQ